jgi:hypothetical protein
MRLHSDSLPGFRNIPTPRYTSANLQRNAEKSHSNVTIDDGSNTVALQVMNSECFAMCYCRGFSCRLGPVIPTEDNHVAAQFSNTLDKTNDR